MRPAPALLLALAILMPASVASAQPDAEPNDRRADELFKEGVRQFDAGHVNEACDAFTESLRLEPKVGTLLNLALCHEHQGKTATAWAEYTSSAAWATQLGQQERRDFANGHAILLEAKLARVALELPPVRELSQLKVEVDGEPLPKTRWFLPLFLDPGEHAIAVSAKGKTPRVIALVIAAGSSTQTVRVPALADLQGEATARPAAIARPLGDPASTRRTAGFVVLGLGVAGLGVGTFFGVRALGQRDDIGAHCTGNTCDAAGLDGLQSAHSSATISTVAFAVGLVGLGVGAALLLTSRSPAAAQSARLTW